MCYAKWALENGISILMDKPISTPSNLSCDSNSIDNIVSDYYELLNLYRKQKEKYPNLIFELLTQRRYHFAFLKIKELIDEVTTRTGVPITSFQTTHCDGQWRMPSEIIDQDYHTYYTGYGKCCHSGYHAIDIMDYLVRNSIKNEKQKIKSIEVSSSFMYPLDFINQLPYESYEKLFSSKEPIKYSIEEYREKVSNYGEIDAQIQLTFRNENNEITTIGQLNLLHNSFSQRNWPDATGKDLYKGNGRIRHEMHYLVQGPFQTIIYESYQSEEILCEKTSNSNVGGEYHLDIHVFRNNKMFNDWKSYEKISIEDFPNKILKGYSRGHQEDARRQAIICFLKAIKKEKVERLSDLEDQSESTNILWAAYKSAYLRRNNQNHLVKIYTEDKNKSLYQRLMLRPYPKNQIMDYDSINWLATHLKMKKNNLDIQKIMEKIKKFPFEKINIDYNAFDKSNFGGIHGIRHQFRVSVFIWLIIQYYNIDIDDNKCIQLLQAALYHDIMRENDNSDINHGYKSAIWITKHYKNLEDNIINSVINHDVVKTRNLTLDDILLKTADALDRYRLPKEKWWLDKKYMHMNIDEELIEICKYITFVTEKETINLHNSEDIIKEMVKCMEKMNII